jgi:hypothetical protein
MNSAIERIALYARPVQRRPACRPSGPAILLHPPPALRQRAVPEPRIASHFAYLGAPTSAPGRNRAPPRPPSRRKQPPSARNSPDRRRMLFSQAVPCSWTPYFHAAGALKQERSS